MSTLSNMELIRSSRRLSQRFVEREARKPKMESMSFLAQPKFIPNPEIKPESARPAVLEKPKRGRGRPRRPTPTEPQEKVQAQLADVAAFIADADTTKLNPCLLPIDMIKRHAPVNHYGHMVDDLNITGIEKVRRFPSFNTTQSNLLPYIDEGDSDVECLDDEQLDEKAEENPFKQIKRDALDEDIEPIKYEFKSLWQYRLPSDITDEPWKHNVAKPDFVPDVLSIVASMFVGQRIDLKEIAMKARNIEYNPDRFAPLIMRVRNPKSTSLIFSSGKMIVTGTRSEAECKLAARKYARIIQRFGYRRVKVLNFEIQNISASTNLKFHVRLRNLAQDPRYKGVVSYEPEMFPGLVYPLEYPKVKSIIFCSGAVLMTGARSEAELKLALETIYPAAKLYGH